MGAFGCCWGPLEIVRGLWGPLGVVGGLWGPLGVVGGLWGFWGFWGLLGAFGDCWGPLGVVGGLWGLVGAFGGWIILKWPVVLLPGGSGVIIVTANPLRTVYPTSCVICTAHTDAHGCIIHRP